MKIIAVIVCLLVSIAQGQAQVEWQLQKIMPMMNGALLATAIIDSTTFIAVGVDSFGIRSTDVGTTWTTLRFPSNSQWFDVSAISGDVVVAVGDQGKVARSTDAGVTWSFDKGPTNSDLYHIWTDRNQLVVATGDNGAIVRSTDAGQSWEAVVSPATGAIPALTSSPTGRLIGFDTTGAIIYSDDRGVSWSAASRDSSWRVAGLIMVSQDSGIAVGMFLGVALTTNGGTSWTSHVPEKSTGIQIHSLPARFFKVVTILNEDRTITVAKDGDGYWKSDTSLVEWTYSNFYRHNSVGWLSDVEVDSKGQKWATTPSGLGLIPPSWFAVERKIEFPRRGSSSFVTLLTQKGACVQYMLFGDQFNAVGSVHASFDYGRSLTVHSVGGTSLSGLHNVTEFAEVDSVTWLLVGSHDDYDARRTYYHRFITTDAGVTWGYPNFPSYPGRVRDAHLGRYGQFCALYENGLYTTVIKPGNQFKSYYRDTIRPEASLNWCYAVTSGLYFAFGFNGSLCGTLDTSSVLQRITVPTSVSLNAMSFADSTFGICVGDSGVIIQTVDAGRTWKHVAINTKNKLMSVHLLNRQSWLLVTGNSEVLITENGGNTWFAIGSEWPSYRSDRSDCRFINENEFLIATRGIVYRGYREGIPSSIPDSMSSRHSVTPTLLSIAPNPSTNSATITVADRSPVLRLYDASGRLVASYTVENGRVVVNTSELSNGVYNVVSDTGSGVLVVNR
ncbi:MAG: T9SS type A sorting domain-containing protein [Ignavibacteria bacterium]|nr:T9SS type A sorting domain-containing protein [Ignavibacteria bacterium]